MSFRFSESHIDSYHSAGYTVFQGIVPPSLLHDLRKAVQGAWQLAREKRGRDAQRLQPLANYGIDLKPFEEFGQLPDLRNAVSKVLTARHTYWNENICGILIEPADNAWCTPWHRDWRRDKFAGGDLPDWDSVFQDINCFNQMNCPLYEDSCTWVVPGSHLREDLPSETEVTLANLQDKPVEERERLCLDYCLSMPGAVCLHLNAGDFALYRNTLWHLGSYVPNRKRATLHDMADTTEWKNWRTGVDEEMASRKEREKGSDA